MPEPGCPGSVSTLQYMSPADYESLSNVAHLNCPENPGWLSLTLFHWDIFFTSWYMSRTADVAARAERVSGGTEL